MACCRRSLTASFTQLTRRLRPSCAHILRDDRETTEPTNPPPLPQFPSRYYSSALVPSISSYVGWRSPGFFVPLGLDLCLLRSYSSATTEGSTEIGLVNDVTEVLSDSGVVETAVAAVPAPFPGEVAAAAADSFLPVAALQHLIDAIHSFTGLNWWASIALTTVLIRMLTVPLLLNQMKATVKLSLIKPEMEQIREEMDTMNPKSLQEGQKRMKELFKKNGVSPFTPLKGLFIQGPVFMSFYFAISNMVEKVPSFKGGGTLWFTDLTTPDPQYILPILTGLAFLATVELNMQEGMEGNSMAKTMKNFSRVLALLTVPFTASFPKAIFCYWVTSNLFSLGYGFVLKRPPVRKFLDLPEVVPQPQPTGGNFSFFGTSKQTAPVAPSTTAEAASPVFPPRVKVPEQSRTSESKIYSSSAISHRIRNLEKTVKARNKTKRR
ncbi:mitochondrial inner membrane protein OXA1-like [Curcuma longa]|uniref:mitochondrial inner membrane protein OXA1-like n=1 Tax=Curcuma longa TaxID=136217 RepID=UPI003D9E7F16